ncbi:RCC1 and BTB domain-containing protein 1 [Camponotus floridanus]|uniref:RCC1 and BTB domain-containing protein 1 n=1 Tax=Camponotus floridanus TaxID=104421 RepID=E2B1F9_CAMFO|nr:RCC1 and BTB domain-containing protein 1 [Camponotus floridanus]
MEDGNRNTAIFNGNVRQVKHGLEKKNVVHIAYGKEFNMVITDKNKLYGWGGNKQWQISPHSNIDSQGEYVYPREIITFPDKIVKMVCGSWHTLALSNKGEIYAWGGNNYGQVGINNKIKSSDPIVVNVPQMGKVLNVDACGEISVAVGYDRSIYVWGGYFHQNIIQPFRTKFSRVFDVFAHSMQRCMHKPLIVHDSVHTVRITNNYNYKYTEKVLNILESLEAAFDDPLTSDFTIQVEGKSIYVHKAILNIRCQYFFDSISDSSPVYTISDKFSYVVYKAFLKYLYSGTIDLPLDNAFELMELADMYCETNLKKNCSQIIKQTITVSNVGFFYNKAIEYDAKELEEFCFQFIWHHTTANAYSEDYIKLDGSTQAKFIHRAIQNDVTITSSTFPSPNQNVERNLEIITKKR